MVPLASSRCHRRLLEANPMHLERGLDRRLGIVDSLARGGTLGGRQRRPSPLSCSVSRPFLPSSRTRTSSKAARSRRRVDIGERLAHKR